MIGSSTSIFTYVEKNKSLGFDKNQWSIIFFLFKNKQTVNELIIEISRQYNLNENEYFGLFYEEKFDFVFYRTRKGFVLTRFVNLFFSDERMWLPSDKKLLDQEIFKRDSSTPILNFAVRLEETEIDSSLFDLIWTWSNSFQICH